MKGVAFVRGAFDRGIDEPKIEESIVTNQDGALYQLEFIDEEQRDSIFRLPAVLELEGRYRRDITTLAFRTHTTKTWDYTDQSGETILYEGLLNLQPTPSYSFDLGKKAYRWGTGYAWNPVAFVERAKDAGNPDLARGFVRSCRSSSLKKDSAHETV